VTEARDWEQLGDPLEGPENDRLERCDQAAGQREHEAAQ
jgi:hypothetical protein